MNKEEWNIELVSSNVLLKNSPITLAFKQCTATLPSYILLTSNKECFEKVRIKVQRCIR